MPHKLERQYQLQAQKRHEKALKLDYYRQTARYFERESAAAKQFSSWSTKGPENYSDRLEKTRRAEKLRSRRDKLKQLLTDENENLSRELQDQKLRPRRSSENLSLEDLRKRLLEKKAEHSLYYPNACRRIQSYAFSPNETARRLESLDIANGYGNVRPVSTHSKKTARFSTSPSIERALYQSSYSNNMQNRESSPDQGSDSSRSSHNNMRFAARNAHQSLQDTNIRSDLNNDQCDSSIRELKGSSPTRWLSSQQNKEPRSDYDQQGHSYQTAEITDERMHPERHCQLQEQVEDVMEREEYLDAEASFSPRRSYDDSPNRSQQMSEDGDGEVVVQQAEISQHEEAEPPAAYVPQTIETNDEENRYRRGNTQQQEADCAGDADISVQMYRYLKHNDLKRKILDLCKREHVFVTKHCWDEALRLREMRNELVLLKNKNLYENHDLEMEETTRQSGLGVIEAREILNKKRAKLCNSMLYSDEARDLWNQWVREDDEIAKTETNAMRDLLLNKLESEWEQLAYRDKNRISQLYDRVMNKSDLQDEHKLAAIIRAANDRQKQYMNYLAT